MVNLARTSVRNGVSVMHGAIKPPQEMGLGLIEIIAGWFIIDPPKNEYLVKKANEYFSKCQLNDPNIHVMHEKTLYIKM